MTGEHKGTEAQHAVPVQWGPGRDRGDLATPGHRELDSLNLGPHATYACYRSASRRRRPRCGAMSYGQADHDAQGCCSGTAGPTFFSVDRSINHVDNQGRVEVSLAQL
jgi:hypothetical protein